MAFSTDRSGCSPVRSAPSLACHHQRLDVVPAVAAGVGGHAGLEFLHKLAEQQVRPVLALACKRPQEQRPAPRKAALHEAASEHRWVGVNVGVVEAEELGPIVTMLENNPELCSTIRRENAVFVDTHLTYDAIMEYTTDLVNALF